MVRPADTTKKITPKQAAFCAEYMIDLNGCQAAIRAGYSKKTAQEQASRMLSNVKVQAEVSRLLQERADRVEITADTVLREILQVARADIGQAFNKDGSLKALHDMPEQTRRAIAGVDVFEEFDGRGSERAQIGWTKKIRFWDKVRALELLGRHLKLFSDKIELTGKDGGPLVMESARPSIEAVSEFSAALFEGFRTFRDEKTGEAAELDQQALASLSEVVSDFAAGGDCHGSDPGFTGGMFARGWLVRKNLRAPASYHGIETDPAP